MVKIKSVELAGVAAQPGAGAPEALVQIAFVGRSNVGKSSLINRLLGRTRARVARVSAQPGKTQAIYFYRVRMGVSSSTDVEFFLVDLPGYGYARVPVEQRERWRELVQSYLSGTAKLGGVVHLVDVRHGPSVTDLSMAERLGELGLPVLVVATKLDKLSRSGRDRGLGRVAKLLGADEEQVVGFSAVTGEGREEVLGGIVELLRGEGVGR